MKENVIDVRLNKYLSEIGYCSRRVADKLIEESRVKINGKIVSMGQRVKNNDVVEIDGVIIENNNVKTVYLAFNKPVGIVCTTDTRVEKNNIINFINYPMRIFPVGRLDKMSEGLILLTNNGDVVNKILRSRNNHEKEYMVTVNKPVTKSFIEKMRNGIPILETITKKCYVEQIHKTKFRIVLTQGLNRQIRRMCEYLGYKVVKLVRVRIMNIKLDIKKGRYRDLTRKELSELKQLIIKSEKTS